MFKQLALSLAALATLPASALTTGDLAFTAFNADEDGFAMVALASLAAGTKVYFSDNEWNGSAFNTGESYLSWTVGAAGVGAGTVVRFSNTDSATLLAASTGTLAREAVAQSSNYGLSQTEDTVYAYLGSSAASPTTFLAAISSSSFGSAAGGSLAGTGLAVGACTVSASQAGDVAEVESNSKPATAQALTAMQCWTVGLGALALSASQGGLPPLPRDPSFWLAISYLAVLCTVCAFAIQNYALRRSDPSRVALLMGSEPVFGALFAWLWLGEAMGPLRWLGGGLMAVAAVMATGSSRFSASKWPIN